MKKNITIQGEYIELFRLLKLARLTETGGQAKDLIRTGSVRIGENIIQELRKKVHPGDVISYGNTTIIVATSEKS